MEHPRPQPSDLGDERFDAQLRWYPAAWRARYGAELAALLEDTYGDRDIPASARFALARAGLGEHARVLWSANPRRLAPARVRDGASLVLCAWALFVIGGVALAKVSEHWDAVVVPRRHPVPAVGFGAVQGAAAVGAAIVGLAAAVVLPAFVRFVRAGGWVSIRRPVTRVVVLTVFTVAAGTSMSLWARHLSTAQRNGGVWSYGIVGLGAAALFVAMTVAWTIASVQVVARLDLSPRVVRTVGGLALGLSAAMAVVFAGTIVWWVAVAATAPRFLADVTGPGSPFAPPLLGAAIVMLAGGVLAARGAARVAGALRSMA